MNRPERRRRLAPQERRASIASAAAQAFDAESFDRVAVADVARAAQTSTALVFHYFPTKADLYAAAVTTRLDALADAVAQALAAQDEHTPARERVRAVVLAHLEHAQRHPAPWAAALDGVGAEPLDAEAARATARARHLELVASFLHPDDRPERHYALVGHVALLDGLTREWVRRGHPEQECAAVVTVVLDSLQGALGDWGR